MKFTIDINMDDLPDEVYFHALDNVVPGVDLFLGASLDKWPCIYLTYGSYTKLFRILDLVRDGIEMNMDVCNLEELEDAETIFSAMNNDFSEALICINEASKKIKSMRSEL